MPTSSPPGGVASANALISAYLACDARVDVVLALSTFQFLELQFRLHCPLEAIQHRFCCPIGRHVISNPLLIGVAHLQLAESKTVLAFGGGGDGAHGAACRSWAIKCCWRTKAVRRSGTL